MTDCFISCHLPTCHMNKVISRIFFITNAVNFLGLNPIIIILLVVYIVIR